MYLTSDESLHVPYQEFEYSMGDEFDDGGYGRGASFRDPSYG